MSHLLNLKKNRFSKIVANKKLDQIFFTFTVQF